MSRDRRTDPPQAVPTGRPAGFVGGAAAALLVFLLSACGSPQGDASGEDDGYRAALQADGRYLVQLAGETMGTTYHVTYFQPGGRPPRNLKPAVDSLLVAFNACLSTYDPASTLSRWNRDATGSAVPFEGACGDWARRLDVLCDRVHAASGGRFDPTVMPLVRYWGFFREDPFAGGMQADPAAIDSLLRLVGWSARVRPGAGSAGWTWIKEDARVQLDFNAVAKGLGVDAVAELLRERELRHWLVEIGGEVVASGRNATGEPWRIALEKPEAGERRFHAVLQLSDAAMATSGNYRRFWERDGERYGHSLNPLTGRPERSRLLSATVVAGDCGTADAWATACMVLGLDAGMAAVEAAEGVEAYFLYLDDAAPEGLAALQSTGFGAWTPAPR